MVRERPNAWSVYHRLARTASAPRCVRIHSVRPGMITSLGFSCNRRNGPKAISSLRLSDPSNPSDPFQQVAQFTCRERGTPPALPILHEVPIVSLLDREADV